MIYIFKGQKTEHGLLSDKVFQFKIILPKIAFSAAAYTFEISNLSPCALRAYFPASFICIDSQILNRP